MKRNKRDNTDWKRIFYDSTYFEKNVNFLDSLNWSKGNILVLSMISKELAIYKKNFKDFLKQSIFSNIKTINNNSNWDSTSIPMKKFLKSFSDSKTFWWDTLPKTYELLSVDIKALANILNSITTKKDRDRRMVFIDKLAEILKVLEETIKNNNNIIIEEIKSKMCLEHFDTLDEKTQKLLVSSYVGMHISFRNFKVFELRNSMTQNLNSLSYDRHNNIKEILDLKKNSLSNTFFYIPFKSMKKMSSIKIANKEFKVINENEITYIITQSEDDIKIINGELEINQKLKLEPYPPEEYGKENVLMHHTEFSIHENVIEHENVQKKIWYADDVTSQRDFLYPAAINFLKENIIKIRGMYINDSQSKYIVEHMISIILKLDGMDQDSFKECWTLLELLSNDYFEESSTKRVRKIIQAFAKDDDFSLSEFDIDEIIMYRNKIVHSSIAYSGFIGRYLWMLKMIISNILKFVVNNVERTKILEITKLISNYSV